ncbi:MAG TPA: diguanylate cyclase [Thermoanaerobaculia bacterium]|jgi:diguanylate cyclase (GGDEF)-like protein
MDAPKIIVIEDDSNLQLMLRRNLEKAGYAVSTASSVAEGRELMNRQSWEIAMLDRGLPDGDGLGLCHELRSTHPHAYIVMLTGAISKAETLEGFANGADDYIAKPAQMDELLARIRAGARIVKLQRALMESNRRLEELSLTDPLTSLRNRRAFEDVLKASFEHARRYERPLSLAIIDLDHFKPINDSFGHPAGDAVLRAVAQLLDGTTRRSDLVARIGGEEFAVLLPETPLFDALQFGEKVRSTIASATIRTGEIEHHVTVSIGVACTAHSHVAEPQELFAAADQALYRAKQNGRNRVEVERRRVRRTEEQPIASSRFVH